MEVPSLCRKAALIAAFNAAHGAIAGTIDVNACKGEDC